MIPQALAGFPGIQWDVDGKPIVNAAELRKHLPGYTQVLKSAVDSLTPWAIAPFLPRADQSVAWTPFLWELSERKVAQAKFQIVGPFTALWTLPSEIRADVADTVFALLWVRAVAMARELKARGIHPVIFLDEPGLIAWDSQRPEHLGALAQIKLICMALRKEGATVGLHCCSQPRWDLLLGLPIDILSLDASLVASFEPLRGFFAEGKRLALGLVPTTGGRELTPELWRHVEDSARARLRELRDAGLGHSSQLILSASCGLAYEQVDHAERLLGLLQELAEHAG
jgi:methionine synthase II (cobalamin-independent)